MTLARKKSVRKPEKASLKTSFGAPIHDETHPDVRLKKRDSKRSGKIEHLDNTPLLLECYNDLKSIYEGKELPNK